jgi:hypothetical protein
MSFFELVRWSTNNTYNFVYWAIYGTPEDRLMKMLKENNEKLEELVKHVRLIEESHDITKQIKIPLKRSRSF